MGQSHGNLHPKQYEIYKRKRNSPSVVTVGGRKVKLAASGPTIIKDAALAADIDQLHGRNAGALDDSLLVVPVDNNHLHEERGHRYTFAVGEMPWHKGKKHVFGQGAR